MLLFGAYLLSSVLIEHRGLAGLLNLILHNILLVDKTVVRLILKTYVGSIVGHFVLVVLVAVSAWLHAHEEFVFLFQLLFPQVVDEVIGPEWFQVDIRISIHFIRAK